MIYKSSAQKVKPLNEKPYKMSEKERLTMSDVFKYAKQQGITIKQAKEYYNKNYIQLLNGWREKSKDNG